MECTSGHSRGQVGAGGLGLGGGDPGPPRAPQICMTTLAECDLSGVTQPPAAPGRAAPYEEGPCPEGPPALGAPQDEVPGGVPNNPPHGATPAPTR